LKINRISLDNFRSHAKTEINLVFSIINNIA